MTISNLYSYIHFITAELEKMTVALEREVYEIGDMIIRQGNTGDQFYIIAEGDVGVYRTEEELRKSLLSYTKVVILVRKHC